MRIVSPWWILAFAACLAAPTPAASQVTVRVVSWNVESGGADPLVVGRTVADMDGVDLWGMSEVPDEAAGIFEAGAEAGEGADFGRLLGTTGGGDRLLILYDADRFELVGHEELHAINTTGRVRAPLVARLRERGTDLEFLFMVNHLYRSRAEERHRQAAMLNAWAGDQELPVVAVGDYNFDWEVAGGDGRHDRGYDLFTAGDRFRWVRPERLVRTQCSAEGDGCRYDSVLDFVFVAGGARSWPARSEIVVIPGDFPDDDATSDHRPVLGVFEVPARRP